MGGGLHSHARGGEASAALPSCHAQSGAARKESDARVLRSGIRSVCEPTRFVSFGSLGAEHAELHRHVREIEAEALNLCQAGTSWMQFITPQLINSTDINAIREHHQGGTTGYLAREIGKIQLPPTLLAEGIAVAWNPSLTGAKIEDTFNP